LARQAVKARHIFSGFADENGFVLGKSGQICVIPGGF